MRSIHVERLWAENRFTAEGNILHKKAHGGKSDHAGPRSRTLRGLPLHSFELGLCGVADVVQQKPGEPPLPVEYKRGRPKKNDCDRVQLCAQALCLEEMTDQPIPRGELFYGKIAPPRGRRDDPGTPRRHDSSRPRGFVSSIESRRTPPADFRSQVRSLLAPGPVPPTPRPARFRARQSFDALLATIVPPTPPVGAIEP